MNKKNLEKIGLLVLVAILIAIFFALDLGRFFTLDFVKMFKADYLEFYMENPVMVVGIFFLVYVLVAGLSLPGATILTVAGGAFFGLVWGTVIVSFASTIGATLGAFLSRFVFRDYVEKKMGDYYKKINQGFEREGAFYLFSLRLIPVFPFFVINLAMGLTKIPLKTFFWVSQLGMLLGTIVYVNVGVQLAEVDSLRGVLSWKLGLSFVLIGLLPILIKKSLEFYKNKLDK